MFDSFLIFGILFAIFIRWQVSRFPYSGAQTPPMYGDYEAQRHWMEITVNLDIDQWYKNSTQNDLLYWGLDYPPLSAYHSFLNGKIASYIDFEWVKLFKSRGFESYSHKIFMRSTVLIADILIYFTGVIFYWYTFSKKYSLREISILSLISLMYPGLILMDHGHFQYNCLSLGFTIWAVSFLQLQQKYIASILFCLALNYKQLSLYHAFPFFFYLLGKSIQKKNLKNMILELILLSTCVLTTFYILWYPFLKDLETALQVVRRLFPVDRGLFEDKVANFWCISDVIFKLKKNFNKDTLFITSVITTLLVVLPSSVDLLLKPSIGKFKYAMFNSSLIFFLFSYQVHEKQILLVSLAATLLLDRNPKVVIWFYGVSTFSLMPLLIKDGLALPYFVTIFLFFILNIGVLADLRFIKNSSKKNQILIVLVTVSLIGCLILSIIQNAFNPPKRFPDIYTLANAVFSFINFTGFLLYFHYNQFQVLDYDENKESKKLTEIKKVK